jgi:hypothetical protein
MQKKVTGHEISHNKICKFIILNDFLYGGTFNKTYD